MNDQKYSIIPNTTQIPHLIIREWMPRLSDVELRILLVVADQTLGWIEDEATGRRKEKDWISRGQLMKKTGRSAKHISKAIKNLIEKYNLIEARSEDGELLDTAEKRRANFGKIFYRLNLHHPPQTLFDDSPEEHRVTKRPTQKGHTTKETDYTKNNIYAAKPQETKKKEEEQKKKPHKEHNQFIQFWHETTQRTRGIKPIITGKDARNLKRVLDMEILSQNQLEQLAIYFLAHPSFRKFSPSIATFLSAGIINGLMNRAKNDPEFWHEIDIFATRYIREPVKKTEPNELVERLAKLKTELFKSQLSFQTINEIQEQVAAAERAAKRKIVVQPARLTDIGD